MSKQVKNEKMEALVSLAKRRGFIYQGSDVYGGLSGTWDYGPLGVTLKRKIMQAWWQYFVEARDDMYGVDAAILMNQKVWQASGHVDTFVDPLCEDGNPLSVSRTFTMMFKTHVGATESDDSVSYLRPETAQGIFTNYKNVVDNFYPNLPFGIAQQGKAFRNEISPRDFVFRSREFEQMEIEYFVHPEKWEEAFDELLAGTHDFL